uniref:Uncharacterized protein n=1 Tax=Lepeophtheirus salmonis TaxID=72036 RepID=A0A0K2UQV9_LEPSM
MKVHFQKSAASSMMILEDRVLSVFAHAMRIFYISSNIIPQYALK